MRKNALAMSIAALVGGLGFVGAASAGVIAGAAGHPTPDETWLGTTDATELRLTTGGIGHQLITPYFNTQNGNATIISLVNTDMNNGKVVKVRFRGASNSDDILDFTVLLSPGDVWNATVSAPSATSPAQIVTNDRSCTLPQLSPGVPQPFVTSRLTNKSGNDVNNNTREGYIEIFNMADVPKAAAKYDGSASAKVSNLYTAIKHVNGVPPCTSTVLNALLTDITVEATAAGMGLATPRTGLFGNWTIINVPQTTTYSGSMVAVRATTALGVDARGRYVVFPQSASPHPTATINQVTADPLLRIPETVAFGADNIPVGPYTAKGSAGTTQSTALTGTTAVLAAAFYDMPDMSTPYVGTSALSATSPLAQAEALTTALARTNVINEYATDAIISAKTDWVFSMPTRRYSVAMDYSATTSRRLYSLVPYTPGAATAQYFHDGNTRINPNNAQQICVDAADQNFSDREEGAKTSGAVFSPGNISVTTLCGEVSVLSFADTGTSVLGASVARQDTGASAFANGWGRVNFSGSGLPVLGDAFIKATNPQVAAGQSGTYGITMPHRAAN